MPGSGEDCKDKKGLLDATRNMTKRKTTMALLGGFGAAVAAMVAWKYYAQKDEFQHPEPQEKEEKKRKPDSKKSEHTADSERKHSSIDAPVTPSESSSHTDKEKENKDPKIK